MPFPPPAAFLVPLLFTLALEWIASTALLPAPWRWIVGAAVLLAGLSTSVAGALAQKRAGTDFDPYRPSRKIVSRGPYRFTRNPMYVGFAIITMGIAILADSAWALLAVPVGVVAMDRLVIAREERYLEGKFGEEYLAYKRRVRRWI